MVLEYVRGASVCAIRGRRPASRKQNEVLWQLNSIFAISRSPEIRWAYSPTRRNTSGPGFKIWRDCKYDLLLEARIKLSRLSALNTLHPAPSLPLTLCTGATRWKYYFKINVFQLFDSKCKIQFISFNTKLNIVELINMLTFIKWPSEYCWLLT